MITSGVDCPVSNHYVGEHDEGTANDNGGGGGGGGGDTSPESVQWPVLP